MSRRTRAAWAAAAFALGALVCWTRDPLRLPLELDNQHYFFIAERAASGVPPHVSHFDPKNAASLLVTAAGIRTARAVGVDDVAGARAVSILAMATSFALLWLLASGIAGSALAGHLAVLALCAHEPLLHDAAMGARPKVFLVPFLLGTSLAVATRRPAWAGLAGAGAFLCWQPALLVPALAAGVLVFADRRIGPALRVAAFAAAPVALYELYYLAHGALAEQLEQAYRFPALYMSHASPDLLRNATWHFRLGEGASLDALWPVASVLVLVGLGVAAARRPAWALAEARRRPGLIHVAVCAAAAIAFVLYDRQSYVDDYFAIPFAAALVGWAGAFFVDRVARGRSQRVRAAVALAALLLAVLPAHPWPSAAAITAPLSEQRRLSAQVAGWVADGESVYAVGCTHLLALARLDNHVRYGFFFRGMDPYMQTLANSPDGYRPLFAGRMPDRILESRGFIPGGRGWLEAEYRDVTPPEFRRQRIRVWRRAGSEQGVESPGAGYRAAP